MKWVARKVGRALERNQDIADKRAQHIADTLFGPRSGGERSEPERSGPNKVSAGPPILGHSQAASLLFIQLADQHRAEVHLPDGAPFGFESDVLPHESFAHKAANP